MRAQKVLWGEGMFLRPQHFQRQDAYHEWRLAETARMLQPYPWGVRTLKIEAEALAVDMLRVVELEVAMPDGEIYSAPHDDELPPQVSLAGLPASVDFHLAMAAPRSTTGNCAEPDATAAAGARYARHRGSAADWYSDGAESELVTLRRSVRLLPDGVPREHLTTLPLLRLRRGAGAGFELDPLFVAPSLSIGAAPPLLALLRKLLDVLHAKIDALHGLHREPSRNIIEFRAGDVASFWLLHTASAAHAGLTHLLHQPRVHPERLFERLLELAGALMSYSRSHTLADLPRYEHMQCGPAFEKLEGIVRDLLETVISTRCFAIKLEEEKPSLHLGRLDSGKLDAASHLYLGVGASLPPAELVEAIPLRLKVGAPDDVDKLILSAMPGVRLTHAPQVPPAIPVRPGLYYFLLEPRGALYERMLQSQTAAIYAPTSITGLQLELVAIAGGNAS